MITETQRHLRREYFGSSDMAVLIASLFHLPLPYKKSETDIYWSKVTDLPDKSSDSIETGNWLEKPLVDWMAKELGFRISVLEGDTSYIAQSGEGAGLFAANLDAKVVGKAIAFEAKFRNTEGARLFGNELTNEVPYDIIAQVQHQMYCSELERVYVGLGTPTYYGVDRKLYFVDRDEDLIEKLVRYGRQWWFEHVEAQLPPNGDTVPPLYVLKALNRKVDAQIRLPDEAVTWADERTILKEQIKTLTGDAEQIDAKIIHALGEAEIGLLADGRKVTYHSYEQNRLDSRQLKIDEPELAQKYMKKSSYRTLYVRKK